MRGRAPSSGEMSMDNVSIDREASQDAQVGHFVTMPVRNEVSLATTRTKDYDNAECALNDRRFITHLKFLTIMQRVIVGAKLKLLDEDQDQLYLGHLHMLHLAPHRDRKNKKNCRAPTIQEWVEVESKIIALEKYLSPTLLTYVEINHLSGKILEKVALWLLGISISALITALLLDNWYVPLLLACFIVWAATTGALGSTAFLYVNALSIQVDPKVDLTSRTLVTMRLILGALFAVILTIPFGYQSFYKFDHDFLMSNQNMEIRDSLLLLLPFTLGFSTPLALSILGRLIQSVRTFFGLAEPPDGLPSTSRHGQGGGLPSTSHAEASEHP
jgi:hypothetical protein